MLEPSVCLYLPVLVAREARVAFRRASEYPRVNTRYFGDSQTAKETKNEQDVSSDLPRCFHSAATHIEKGDAISELHFSIPTTQSASATGSAMSSIHQRTAYSDTYFALK
jgi:hypothetical protein